MEHGVTVRSGIVWRVLLHCTYFLVPIFTIACRLSQTFAGALCLLILAKLSWPRTTARFDIVIQSSVQKVDFPLKRPCALVVNNNRDLGSSAGDTCGSV